MAVGRRMAALLYSKAEATRVLAFVLHELLRLTGNGGAE